MKILRLIKLPFLCILVAVVSIPISPLVMAQTDNSKGPGSGCHSEGEPVPTFHDPQYAPPPYTGTLTFTWYDYRLYLSGTVEQAGNSNCVGNVSEPYFAKRMDLATFLNLEVNDIKGMCFIDLPQNGSFNCIYEGGIEIVGVGNLKRISETSFTANVVIMQLIERTVKSPVRQTDD